MDLKDSIYIGQIAKLHGYKGGVSLFLDVSHPDEYKDIESFFVDIDGILTPFFVESFPVETHKPTYRRVRWQPGKPGSFVERGSH